MDVHLQEPVLPGAALDLFTEVGIASADLELTLLRTTGMAPAPMDARWVDFVSS